MQLKLINLTTLREAVREDTLKKLGGYNKIGISIQELFRYALAIFIIISFISMITYFFIGLKNKNYVKAKTFAMEKPYIMYAFTNSICKGTEKFNDKHCILCFDNLKFIGKDKVGFGVGESHAGNELLDFIDLYIDRYYSKEMMMNDYILQNKVS